MTADAPLTARRRLGHLFRTSRPLSWINTAYPFGAAWLLAGGDLGPTFWVGCLFFLIPYNLAMYGINDVFDYESDLRNPRKGGVEGDVLDRRVHRTVVHTRQQFQVVAEAVEDVDEQVEVDGRHLRAQDGVARLLHLLREHRARELGGGAFALAEALAHLGRGLLGERGGSARGGRSGRRARNRTAGLAAAIRRRGCAAGLARCGDARRTPNARGSMLALC